MSHLNVCLWDCSVVCVVYHDVCDMEMYHTSLLTDYPE